MPRPARFFAVAAAIALTAAARVGRADDVIGLAGFVAGASASRSNVTSGEGANFIGGWRTDLAYGQGMGSMRLGADAMLGGGNHVFAQRLGIGFLPGVRAKLGESSNLFFRLGVDARFDKTTSFSIRHLSLPLAEVGFRWTTSRAKARNGLFDPLDPPKPPEALDVFPIGLMLKTVALIALLDPGERAAVSFDLAAHGGLALLGDYRFATVLDDARREVPDATAKVGTSGALGGNATLAVYNMQLRASYTRFAASRSVDEVRGSLCGSVLLFGLCADTLIVRIPTDQGLGAGHALGVAAMFSGGVVLGGHRSF